MFVRQMLGPEDGRNCVTSDPTWLQVREAFLRLDNRSCTALTLRGETQNPSLSIGGGKDFWIEGVGWDTYYFVFITNAMATSYILYDPSVPSYYPNPAQIMLCLGGQESEKDAQTCVNRAITLQALEVFFKHGQRDTFLNWLLDNP